MHQTIEATPVILHSSAMPPPAAVPNGNHYYTGHGRHMHHPGVPYNKYGRTEPHTVHWQFHTDPSRVKSMQAYEAQIAQRSRRPISFRENIASTLTLHQNTSCVSRFGGLPWKKPDTKYSAGVDGLTEEIEDFFKYITPTSAEQSARNLIVDRIKRIIKKHWPKAVVEVFGSFRTNLFLPTGDIDLVISGKWGQIPPLYDLERLLVDKEVCDKSSLRVLDKASVPLIKFRDRYTEIAVDISLNQINCVAAAEFVLDRCREFPCLPPLAMVMKQFLNERNLNEVFIGGLSSYSLILMILNFLQVHDDRQMVRSAKANLGLLLMEFLDFFGDKFDYEKYGLRVKNGGSRMKREELRRDMMCCLTGPSTIQQLEQSSHCLLFIEDPLTPGNNVSKSSYSVGLIKEEFRQAHRALKAGLGEDRDPYYSVLGRIIRITDYVVLHRVRLGQLVQRNDIAIGQSSTGKAPTAAAASSPGRKNGCHRRRTNESGGRDATAHRHSGTESAGETTSPSKGRGRSSSPTRTRKEVTAVGQSVRTSAWRRDHVGTGEDPGDRGSGSDEALAECRSASVPDQELRPESDPAADSGVSAPGQPGRGDKQSGVRGRSSVPLRERSSSPDSLRCLPPNPANVIDPAVASTSRTDVGPSSCPEVHSEVRSAEEQQRFAATRSEPGGSSRSELAHSSTSKPSTSSHRRVRSVGSLDVPVMPPVAAEPPRRIPPERLNGLEGHGSDGYLDEEELDRLILGE